MAVLGVDGTQATNQAGTPAVGHIQVKDGLRALSSPGDYQTLISAAAQVGYVEAKSGGQLVYAVYLNDLAITSIEEFNTVLTDQGAIASAIYEGY
jgi:D-alanyl-D-alanine carboxypeptidase